MHRVVYVTINTETVFWISYVFGIIGSENTPFTSMRAQISARKLYRHRKWGRMGLTYANIPVTI